jgi:hypothetical protein
MCSKTLEAADKQSGYFQKIDQAESVATEKGKAFVGKDVVAAGTVVAAAVQFSQGRSAAMKFKCGSICDTMTLSGAKTKGSLGLGWKF